MNAGTQPTDGWDTRRSTNSGDAPAHLSRVAYLILSHHHPERVEALAQRILDLSPNGEVVVHHDATSAPSPWGGGVPARVHLVPPIPVRWGDWSVVEATLRLLRHALDRLNADWMVLLSGDDRPIVDLETWELDTCSSGMDAMVAARPLTKRPVLGRRPTADDLNFARYSYRWSELPHFEHRVLREGVEIARRASRFLQPLFKIEYAPRRERAFLGLPRRRVLPNGLTLYCGPQWMALGTKAAKAVVCADDGVVEWFKRTWIPDQGFFHTVLFNDPTLRILNERLTYVVPQSKAKTRTSWMTLRREDLADVRCSGSAFARKFDPSIDADVLQMVDAFVDATRDSGVRPARPNGHAPSKVVGPSVAHVEAPRLENS